MKNILKMMKLGDVIIVVLLIALSFLPFGIFTYQNANANTDTLYAQVLINGEVAETMELVDDGEIETFEFMDEHGHYNIIVRDGAEVYMVEADCPDQLCVEHEAISSLGETIICLPNTFIVEIASNNPDAVPNQEVDIITGLFR